MVRVSEFRPMVRGFQGWGDFPTYNLYGYVSPLRAMFVNGFGLKMGIFYDQV